MILFIILVTLVLIWIVFDGEGVIDCFKKTIAGKKSIKELIGDLAVFLVGGVAMVAAAAGVVYVVSALAFAGSVEICPKASGMGVEVV